MSASRLHYHLAFDAIQVIFLLLALTAAHGEFGLLEDIALRED